MNTIAVIDYGMGNLRSVAKALEYAAGPAARVILTGDPDTVLKADRVVFPGQGAAGDCMRTLRATGLGEAIHAAAGSKPFLGLCMGMQALVEHSEENGGTECLGLLPGRVRYFGAIPNTGGDARFKIPHMGWNQVHQCRAHPLWKDIPQDSRFYFVHSYFLQPDGEALMTASTDYGIAFASAIGRDNIFALQCHPEKSAGTGLTLLSNFARWDGTI